MYALVLGLTLGVCLRRLLRWEVGRLRPLTFLLTNLAYPALIFSSILKTYDAASILGGLTTSVGVFGTMALGFALGGLWARRVALDSEASRGTLRFCCTVSNYAFLPLVLAEALWGEAARSAVVLGALGGDVALWTLGAACFPRRAGGRWWSVINPPLLTLAGSVILVFTGHTGWARSPVDLVSLLEIPGRLAVPAGMILLGYHLAGVEARHLRRPLLWKLSAFRLLLVPAVVGLCLALLPLDPASARVVFLVAAMPVAMATVYLGDVFGGDNTLGAGAVLHTHVLAVITVPLWLWTLGLV